MAQVAEVPRGPNPPGFGLGKTSKGTSDPNRRQQAASPAAVHTTSVQVSVPITQTTPDSADQTEPSSCGRKPRHANSPGGSGNKDGSTSPVRRTEWIHANSVSSPESRHDGSPGTPLSSPSKKVQFSDDKAKANPSVATSSSPEMREKL